MRVEWALGAILVAGCDVVWSIDHVGDPTDDAANPSTCKQGDHDEDHDAVPDACDRCPGISDDQRDTDDDSVGDMCDPSGSTRDKLALFVSFAEPPTNWHTLVGSWPSDGDSLSYDSITLNNYGVTLYTGVVPDPPYVFEVHFAIESIDAQVSAFGVLFDADPSGQGAGCDLDRQATMDVIRASDVDSMPSAEAVLTPFRPGGYRIVTKYDRNGAIECSVRSDDSTIVGGVPTPLTPAPAPGTLGFRSFRVGVRVHYLALYQTY